MIGSWALGAMSPLASASNRLQVSDPSTKGNYRWEV